MKIGLDLDGTIYDTLEPVFALDQQVRRELGYGPISKAEYRRLFQTEDWTRLCIDLGIRENDIGVYRQRVEGLFWNLEPPELVPGGKEAVRQVEEELGLEKLYIVTNNRNVSEIKRRFARDGLSYLFERVSHPYEGKAGALLEIAVESPGEEFVYVGDLISDGRACKTAREMGADNVRFCAILHKYAMNPPEMLKNFADTHDFACSIESVDEIAGLSSAAPLRQAP